MIAAQDLRIDNWLIFDGRYFQIDCIAKDAPFLNTEEFGVGVVSYKNIMPINLSHKILEKCGFVEDEYNILSHPILKCRWVTNHFLGELLEMPFLRFDSTKKPSPNISTDIYYLHQLQNIHYCLVGQELQVKL